MPSSLRPLLLCGLLPLAACAQQAQDGLLTGYVTDSNRADAQPVVGATVQTHSAENEKLDQVQTGENGTFQAKIPFGGGFFVQIDGGADTVPTSFTAASLYGIVEAQPGDLWTRTASQLDAIRAEFSTCPGATASGGIVEGEVRVLLPVEQLDALPLVTTATIQVIDAAGESHAACYLDDRGQSDPAATQTGATGRFAVFGVPPGVSRIEAQIFVPEEEPGGEDTGSGSDTGAGAGAGDTEDGGATIDLDPIPLRLVEGGVAPLYPLWAQL